MKGKDKIAIDGIIYAQSFNRNGLSACALCEIKAKCWKLYHYDTPCFGGYYVKTAG